MIRHAGRLALGTWVIVAALLPVSLLLLVAESGIRARSDIVPNFFVAPAVVIFSGLGAIIASRRQGNAIGWLFCGFGLLASLAIVTDAYGFYAAAIHPIIGATWAIWLSNVLPYPVMVGMLTLPFLLFPDGHLLSKRWRPVLWLTILLIAAITVFWAFVPTVTMNTGGVTAHNPARIALVARMMERLTWLVYVAGPIVVLAPIVSLFLRYRHGQGAARQQVKLIAYAAILTALLFALSGLGPEDSIAPTILGNLFVLGLAIGLPFAVTVAILRYHLWDIDRIINRTLVYGGLTVSLALTYIGGVLLLQYLLSPITRSSDLAIALTTLAVAALFQPVRHRIQALVDRRFFRQKYDAQRILASFGITARDEVDLERLANALTSAIDEAMQPAHVAVWLRDTETT